MGIAFDNHILNENNAYQLVIENEADLAGLPEWVKAGAAEEAKAAGKEGKWLFTLQNSSRLPFLQYAENRELRKIFMKLISTGGIMMMRMTIKRYWERSWHCVWNRQNY